MLTKVLITSGIVVGAMLALRVFGRAAEAKMARTEDAARDSVRRRIDGEDFVKCGRCGSYASKKDPCSCTP